MISCLREKHIKSQADADSNPTAEVNVIVAFFAIGSPKADAESVRLGAKSALNPANPYLAGVKAAHCQKIE